jgi:ATP-binding cassette, subfamily C, bacterial
MKYQWVRQLSGEDCGAASLAIITKHYGYPLKINRIREIVGTSRGGTTLLGLKQGAFELGFQTHVIKAIPDILNEIDSIPLPAIIYWQGYHFVVLYGKESDKYVVSDPAMGIRYLTRAELEAGWESGVMLLLEPDPVRFEQQAIPVENSSVLATVTRRLLPHRSLLIKVILLNLLLGVLSLAAPILMQFLTDKILVQQNRELLVITAVSVLGLYIVESLVALTQSNLVARFAERFQAALKADFGKQILNLPFSYHEARRSGTVMSRLGDIQLINQLISQVIIILPSQLFVALVSITVIAIYSWTLAIISIVIASIIGLITILFKSKFEQAIYRSFTTTGETYKVLAESFNGVLAVKTMGAAPQLWQEIEELLHQEKCLNIRTAQLGINNAIFTNLLVAFSTILLLWWGSNLVFAKQLTIGQLIAVKGLNDNFLVLARTLVGFAAQFTRVKTVTQMLDELFDYTPENQDSENKPLKEISATDDLVCKKINFHYAGRVRLLEDFCLNIPGGKVTAIIGRSGCGKSTLAKIFTGIYPIQSGQIFVGNQNLLDLPLDCLRRQVVLVPQETFFFTRSIIDNFRLLMPHATIEDIINACKIVGADEFIQQFPQGYETTLGAVAANLSGGQKQRLGIARGILNDPQILILDESTANLDPPTEAEVLDGILRHRQGKTTILISHRPRVISRADWVVLMDGGKVKIQGFYQSLIEQPGEHLEFLSP